MAVQQPKPTDNKMMFIKFSRGLSYFIYGVAITAAVFLSFGFFLLLFSANPSTGFVQFVYKVAAAFLEPFRGIFPPHQVSETGYFSSAALFAIIFYLFFAACMNALINYINLKMYKHSSELDKLQADSEAKA
jgi:uncharacterized protein YggT (Ycf19 family)